MTTAEARKRREVAEAEILAALRRLSEETKLDLCKIEVFLALESDSSDTPLRCAKAVRIELAV